MEGRRGVNAAVVTDFHFAKDGEVLEGEGCEGLCGLPC
jgi:hypothetical protein